MSARRWASRALALVVGLGADLARGGLLLRAADLVGALPGDELLLAASELDPVGELVLGDRALVLDRGRAAGEGRLVGLALDLLACGLLQRLLDLGRRRDVGDADGDDLQAELGERRLLAEPAVDPRADRRDALGEDRAQRAGRKLVDDELLGELREQPADLLERLIDHRPESRSTLKSIRSASRAGSATRNVIAPCTVMRS